MVLSVVDISQSHHVMDSTLTADKVHALCR